MNRALKGRLRNLEAEHLSQGADQFCHMSPSVPAMAGLGPPPPGEFRLAIFDDRIRSLLTSTLPARESL
jgi:hypothetical protein